MLSSKPFLHNTLFEEYTNICVSESLSKNHVKGAVGGVTPDTYIAFLIIECLA